MLVLPKELQDAITHALTGVSEARWMRAAQELSERYRAPRTGTEPPLVSGTDQALGYAALLLPATYAQLIGAMEATRARIPDWAPETLLDLGSGPGTALWAAASIWPSLRQMTAWEVEPAFVRLGRELARNNLSVAVREARWERAHLRQLGGVADKRYAIVVIGHVLNELDPALQRDVITQAWIRTEGLLLIVEPGTSAGFAVVRAARDHLLGLGAQTIAPCAHDHPCPLVNDWCHFPRRLKRPPFQRKARSAPSEWEDSKFSYAALARFGPIQPIWGRIIREVINNKAYAETTISTDAGVARYRALKRRRDLFRHLKELEWGQALEEPLPEDIENLF
jgi:ribosomal protein RSM22 (predicted rRNA methylase)